MEALPPWLRVLYPFEGKTFGGTEGRLHYVDTGEDVPVVMLHGNPTWSFFYRDLILALRGKHRCLALDHLGCGLSEKPSPADYTLAGHIRRGLEWLDSLETGPFHLVVHDWGGAIGFGMARERLELVRSITVLNTAAFPFPTIPLRIAACRWPLVGTLMVRGANAFVEAATVMTTREPLPEAVREGYRFPYANWSDRVAVAAFVKDIPMRRRHRSWKLLESIGDSLRCWRGKPVQILWGMRDWCFHEGILAQWQRRLPEAEVHTFTDAGHYLLEDEGPEVIGRIGAFVERHS
ncbi:MAG: alpha/beta fold hydrolase [Oceanipulchritudo sp.]